MEHPSKLAYALAWAARGFKIFPVVAGTKDQPTVPFTAEATTDEMQIRKWWQDPLTGHLWEHNIGVLTDGKCVVDIDTKEDRPGVANFYGLGGTFDGLTVRTPSGGYHVYTQPPYEVAGAQWKEQTTKEVLGLDIRGFHGYVLAPGSTTPQGNYELCVDGPVVATPAAIMARCRAPGDRAPTAQLDLGVTLDTSAALQAARALVERHPGAPSGARNEDCYKLAARIRDLGISEFTARDLILEHWADRCSPPLERDEAVASVAHAYEYAQNAAGAKSAQVDFAGITVIEPPALQEAQQGTRGDEWRWGNVIPLHLIPPRPWVVDRMFMRGELTSIIAPGGIGKSQFLLTVAILLALGRDVFGNTNKVGRAKSLIYNAEDSRAEMSMRFFATCHHLGVDPQEVAPYITLISGKELRLKLVHLGQDKQPQLDKDTVAELVRYLEDPECAFCGLDPLLSLHDVDESLNQPMHYVLETLVMIAEKAKVAVAAAIHTAKPSPGSKYIYAGNADAGRGAATIRDTSRIVLTLATPSERDADEYDMAIEDRFRLLRLDDAKLNYGLLNGKPAWLYKHSVLLANGEFCAAFALHDIATAFEQNREILCTKIAEEMATTDNSATLSIRELGRRLRAVDPLYAPLSDEMIKTRLRSAIGVGYETPLGNLRIIRVHGTDVINLY